MANTATTPGGKSPVYVSHVKVSAKLLFLAVGMFGFGYLMIPLYDIICDVTGLNGKTGRVSSSLFSTQNGAAPVTANDREITVEFVGIVNAGGAWEFRPNVSRMTVRPGVLYDATFFAKNLSMTDAVGQASPSVSPSVAAKYFNKTECFCFTRQEFEANGSRDMPLRFVIDPDIPPNVDLVTLSYTFFRAPDSAG